MLANKSTTLIIPTYQEVDNITDLCHQIHQELSSANVEYQILFMDDNSSDGSEEIVKKLSQTLAVSMHVRKGLQRDLSESIMDGLKRVKNGYIVIMDADLSHSPSDIVPMLKKLQNQEADFIVGSRYTQGAEIIKPWGFRYLNSKIAVLLAKPLIKINDPMSGFFAFHRDNLPKIKHLNPIGYKIALEILVKGNFLNPQEHPISFKNRTKGKSKLSLTEQIKYLRHLRRLYQYKYSTWAELFQFASVGSIGLMIDLLFYYLLQMVLGLNHQLARALSFWPAVSSNWFLNRNITFNQRIRSNSLIQWIKFISSSLIGFSINWGSYMLLTKYIYFFAQYKIVALLMGVLLGVGFNFMFSNLFIFYPLRREKH